MYNTCLSQDCGHYRTLWLYLAGEGECAAKCAVPCAGTELCQFQFDSCSKSCILGNFNKEGAQKPIVINDDNLPLSAIKVLKIDPAIIGKSLFDTADAGTCGGATPITVTAGIFRSWSDIFIW